MPLGGVASSGGSADLTMMRPPAAIDHPRSWRQTLALSAAGALAGAVLALGVLGTGDVLLGPDAGAADGPGAVEQVVTTGR